MKFLWNQFHNYSYFDIHVYGWHTDTKTQTHTQEYKNLKNKVKDAKYFKTKIVRFLSLASQKTFFFFTLLKLNITFYFECYLHHDCSVNLNWNNTQLYSSPKPLRNVPNSVFWFVNFCFLPFLRRTSVQKWKKNWVCYIHKWIGKKGFLFAEALNFSQGSKYDSFLSTSRLK